MDNYQAMYKNVVLIILSSSLALAGQEVWKNRNNLLFVLGEKKECYNFYIIHKSLQCP